MKTQKYLAIAGATLLALGGVTHAATIYGFEATDPGFPFTANPDDGTFAIAPSLTTGVTQGASSLGVTAVFPGFGGPISTMATNASLATALNGADSVNIDLTLPATPLSYGNLALSFNQTQNGVAKSVQTGYSPDFTVGNAGKTITLNIPLTQFGRTTHIFTLDPTQMFSFQIDFSFNVNAAAGGTFPTTFYVDNLATTPEPASIGLLAIGGGVLLRRRRA